MNNFFNALLMALGVVFIAAGCSTESFNLDSKSAFSAEFINIPNEYSIVGTEHNNGLEYAFQTIKKQYLLTTRNGEKQKLTKEDLLKIGARATNDFCAQNRYFGANESLCQEVLSSSTVNVSPLTRSDINETRYSPELQQFIERLKKAISHVGNGNMKQFKNEIENLVAQAQLSLDETELIGFYAGAITAYSSMAYWTENHQKWQIALNCPELLSSYTDEELNNLKIKNGRLISNKLMTRSWWDDAWSSIGETWDSISDTVSDWWNNGGSDVVGADAGDAVAGAIGGAITGSAAGGIGAGPGAIAGGIAGGCYGSISEAISQWIN